ncbi:MAG: hypothetical protein ACREVZ_14315, partial [Burkholderiales bacterium]
DNGVDHARARIVVHVTARTVAADYACHRGRGSICTFAPGSATAVPPTVPVPAVNAPRACCAISRDEPGSSSAATRCAGLLADKESEDIANRLTLR